MSARDLTEVATFSDCVIGYRSWSIDALGQLRPLTVTGAPWQPGVNIAHCHHQGWSGPEHPDDQAPHPQCSCGFYAMHRLGDITYGEFPPDDELTEGVPVIGAIAAFGRMLVHHHGFRAQKAGVVALATSDDMGPLARCRIGEVAERYRVAWVDLADLEAEASRHGTPLPDSIRPTREEVEREQMKHSRQLASATVSTHMFTSSASAAHARLVAMNAGPPTRVPSRALIAFNGTLAGFCASLFAVTHWWLDAGCAVVCATFAALDARTRRRARKRARA